MGSKKLPSAVLTCEYNPRIPISRRSEPVSERFAMPTFRPPEDFRCSITIETALRGMIRSTAKRANRVTVLPAPLNPVINNNSTRMLSISENRIICPCNLLIGSLLMAPD